jgi:hypothetical protein
MMGASVKPGQEHFPLLQFYLAHPQFSHYWIIEFDVRFSGSWQTFFRACAPIQADLLTAHIRRYSNASQWPWWDSLQHPSQSIPRNHLIKSFNPVARLSAPGLDSLHQQLLAGWKGHFEVVLPTLIHHGALRLVDIGPDGAFSSPKLSQTFYTKASFRYRPPLWRLGRKTELLYHPVKPWWWAMLWHVKRMLSRQ